MTQRLQDPLLAILVLGLLLRLAWALLIPVEPVSDSAAYDTLARNIVEHGVFGFRPDEPSAYWAVGASALAAATYTILGDSYWGIVTLNIVAALVTAAFVERLGTRYFGRIAGLCAACTIALWPNLILFTTILSSELYFILFTVAGLWFWSRGDETRWTDIVLAGVCWAAACYMRPIILLFPVALLISAIPGGPRRFLRAGANCAVAMAVILALVAPWTYRNFQVFGEPVLMSTNFGANFWMGNNPESEGDYMPLPAWTEGMGEVERSDALLEQAKNHIRSEPGTFVRRTIEKALLMHSWESIGVAWNEPGITSRLGAAALLPLKLLLTGYWFVVLGLALAGFVMLLSREGVRGLFHPVVAGWAYFTAIHAIVVAGDRYHMPSVPFMALLAGLALAQLATRPAVTRFRAFGGLSR
ncbi:ArnT family glycosyltransferase [Rubellimicrobium rubrum]|uniref:ArnT family glycosyltransferase n=1 Tax=Rubellimicrobium rubrum TaxID=2585369 RepID=UPI00159BD87D|nr:glycosyltransferase family 39 protein [Rubellimicrobium rubrum]